MVRSLGVTVMAVATIGVSLAVLATFALVIQNLRRISGELGDQVGLSAYLDPNRFEEGRKLAKAAAGWPGVERTWVLTSTEALSDFRRQLGRDAVLLEGLPTNVIPPSVEVRLFPRHWRVEEVAALAELLQAMDAVVDVRYGQEDIERVSALLGVARSSALILGIALCFATILVIYNTIRLTLYARRDEIEIMSLVGATASFLRIPFLIEGTVQGVMGGLVATVVIFALEDVLITRLEQGLAYARGAGIELQFVSPGFGLLLILSGALLGLAGSLLAMGRFLRF